MPSSACPAWRADLHSFPTRRSSDLAIVGIPNFCNLNARMQIFFLGRVPVTEGLDRKSTRLNSSHLGTSYAVFCLPGLARRSTLFPYTTLFRSSDRGDP